MVKFKMGRRRSGRGSPIVGVIVGVMFTVPAILVLFLSEQHAVNRKLTLKEGESSTRSVASDSINPENEQQLVHLHGALKTNAILKDRQFSIQTKAVHLRRRVEMYQWVESKRTSSSSSSSSSTTYSYHQRWATGYHNSRHFYRSGYDNPPMPIKGNTWSANKVTIGAFSLSNKLIKQFDDFQKIPVDKPLFDQMPEKEKQKYRLEEGLLINKTGSQDNPQIGDIRITFLEARPASVTILAMQSGNSFKAFPTRDGETKLEQTLALGEVSIADLFKAKSLDNLQNAWIVRSFTFIFAFIGALVLMSALNKISENRTFLFPIAGGKWLPRTSLAIITVLTLIMTIHWLGQGITGIISLCITLLTAGGWAKLHLTHTRRSIFADHDDGSKIENEHKNISDDNERDIERDKERDIESKLDPAQEMPVEVEEDSERVIGERG